VRTKIILLFFILIVFSVYCQDFKDNFIRKNGSVVPCFIEKVENGTIYYYDISGSLTMISASAVTSYKKTSTKAEIDSFLIKLPTYKPPQTDQVFKDTFQTDLKEYYIYCQIQANQKLNLKWSIRVDFGESLKYGLWWERLKDKKTNEVIEFNSLIDAINYMSKNGWEYVDSYIIVAGYMGSTASTNIVIMRKKIINEK